MNRTAGSRRLACCVWALLGSLAGCAGFDVPDPPIQDVTPQREQRTEQTVREFEAKRDIALYQAAVARWDQQDVAGCCDDLQRLLQRNPNHCDARLLLAEVYMGEHRHQEALGEVQQALAACPDQAKVQYAMGLTLESTGRLGEALVYYQKAAEIEPGNELYAVSYRAAHDAVVHPTTTAAYMAPSEPQGDPATARTIDRQPPRFNAAEPPSELRFRESAETAGRARGSESVASTDCGDAQGLIERGREALADDASETATVLFREAMSVDPQNPQIPISAATAALRYGRADVAAGLLTAAAAQFPRSAAIHRVLGVAYYRLGDYQSSQVALQQALSLDKSSSLSYFLLGCTLAKLGQNESAEAYFKQARTLDPKFTVWR